MHTIVYLDQNYVSKMAKINNKCIDCERNSRPAVSDCEPSSGEGTFLRSTVHVTIVIV